LRTNCHRRNGAIGGDTKFDGKDRDLLIVGRMKDDKRNRSFENLHVKAYFGKSSFSYCQHMTVGKYLAKNRRVRY
jgi:hypothetical protein